MKTQNHHATPAKTGHSKFFVAGHVILAGLISGGTVFYDKLTENPKIIILLPFLIICCVATMLIHLGLKQLTRELGRHEEYDCAYRDHFFSDTRDEAKLASLKNNAGAALRFSMIGLAASVIGCLILIIAIAVAFPAAAELAQTIR